MSGLQAQVSEEVEDGLSAFCGMLAASLLDLARARQRGISGVIIESMAPLREVLTAFEVYLAVASPNS